MTRNGQISLSRFSILQSREYLSPFKFRLSSILAPFKLHPFNFRSPVCSSFAPFNFRPHLQTSKYWPNPLRCKIRVSDVVGHIPREIRRVCNVFLNNRGALEGRVLDNKYRRSPIHKGEHELPIAQIVGTNISLFSRMKEFVDEYYIEVEKMTVSSGQYEVRERMAYDDLDEYDHEEENTVELELQLEQPETQGRTILLSSKSNACLTFGIRIKTKVIS